LETVGRGFGAVIFIPDGTCEDGEAQTVGARLQVTFKDPGTGYWGHRPVLATRLRDRFLFSPAGHEIRKWGDLETCCSAGAAGPGDRRSSLLRFLHNDGLVTQKLTFLIRVIANARHRRGTYSTREYLKCVLERNGSNERGEVGNGVCLVNRVAVRGQVRVIVLG